MRFFVLKLVIFSLPLWAASYLLTGVLDNCFRKNHTHKELWSLSQHNRSFDYAVAGSSRAFHNIDTVTLEKRTGSSTVINLGFDGLSMMDIYLTLHLFLAHQNRTQQILLQLDGWDLDYSHRFLSYLYVPYSNDDQVAAMLGEFSPVKRNLLARVFPMAKYADYNSFYTHTLLAQTKSNHSAYDESAGSELMLDDDYHGVPAIDREAGFIVDARARRYLDRIVDLARSREIRITVFSAPIYRDPRFKDYVQESRAYIASYCQALGIPFIDFTEADFDRSEFRDYNHLNGRGALRLTGMLADSLLELETKPLP